MPKGIECQWEGQIYPSIADAARAAGILYDKFFNYHKHGLVTHSQVIAYKVEVEMRINKGRRKGVEVEWEGQIYPSFSAAARLLDIAYSVVRNRHDRGWKCRADINYS